MKELSNSPAARGRRGRIRNVLLIPLVSLILIFFLVLGLRWNAAPRSQVDRGELSKPLKVYCAAGLKPVIEPLARRFTEELGIQVQIQYGGSGTLLGNLKLKTEGDLFLAADSFFMELAKTNLLVEETLPLARLRPVIAVAKGNVKGIRGLADLAKPNVRWALPSPEAAAIGKVAKDVLTRAGVWNDLAARAVVFKPTVNELANDLKLGSADATIVWDATVKQYPEIEVVPVDIWGGAISEVSAGVLEISTRPSLALKLARYLSAPSKGGVEFVKQGYEIVAGDEWEETPEVVVYSGGVNRRALELVLRQFEQREGVVIHRVYNGCGILTAQIRAGQRPDGYLACDVPFLKTVEGSFQNSHEISETELVIAMPKANPKGIATLASLATPGLRIGVANEDQSALGALTQTVLRFAKLESVVNSNVVVRTPTADLLLNQLRTGSLDAAIVYEANVAGITNDLAFRQVLLPGAYATQPWAVGKFTRFPLVMSRLTALLRSEKTGEQFNKVGFRWKGGVN